MAKQENSVKQNLPMVIVASSAGMLVEWYDFYIFGSLATIIATKFFPAGNPALALISTLATFAVGFVVRPFGALVFGRIGDLIGRKRTFMVTLLIMGISTVLVGLVPEYETIGIMAPILVLILRLLQGLALGGEYGGAASFVAEHAPAHRRGYLTSWIQTTAAGGIFVSLLVIFLIRQAMTKEAFEDWGWRVPFLISAVLVIISYYIRKGMDESPMFSKLKAEGKTSKNPLKDSFGHKYNLKFVLLALLGATMGAGIVFYTSQFYPLQFMKITMAIDADQTENILSWGLLAGIPFFVIFGKLSDKIGRKWIMLFGMFLAIILYRPIFGSMYQVSDLDLKTEMVNKTTITTEGSIVIEKGIPTQDSLFTTHIHKEYTDGTMYNETVKQVVHGNKAMPTPAPIVSKAKILNGSDKMYLVLMIFILVLFVAMTYGPIPAFLVELFPTKIRYTSMSLPYHIGFGIFGGLMPAIAAALVFSSKALFDKAQAAGVPLAQNPNATYYLDGLWYPIIAVGICLVIGLLYLKETKHVNIDE